MTNPFKYIIWQSRVRGQQTRDCKIIECSTLDSALSYMSSFAFKSSAWIEPVRGT
jgi:hypothetical protein